MTALTGPNTPEGKAAVSFNALSHGVMSTRPVVPGLESADEWEAHRRGVFEYYRPDGHVQESHVYRIALIQWRLNRVVRYETEEITLAQETAEDDAAPLIAAQLDDSDERLAPAVIALPRDPAPLRGRLAQARLALRVLPSVLDATGSSAIPKEEAEAALRFVADYVASGPLSSRVTPRDRWTGASLREALGHVAVNRALGDVLGQTIAFARHTVSLAERQLARIEAVAARLRRQRVLPSGQVLDRVAKYESHLNRQLASTIRELEALQAARNGQPIPAARLHVTGLPETGD